MATSLSGLISYIVAPIFVSVTRNIAARFGTVDDGLSHVPAALENFYNLQLGTGKSTVNVFSPSSSRK